MWEGSHYWCKPCVGGKTPLASTRAPDPKRFQARRTAEQIAKLTAGGLAMTEYRGMMAEMRKNTLIIDDISAHEIEKLIETSRPDIICSGIKDKFVIEKMGIPCKQLHNYDYGGPYAAFTGAANFYREIDRMLHTQVWKFVVPPWLRKPQLQATFGFNGTGRAS